MSEAKYTPGPWIWNSDTTWLEGAKRESVLEYAGCGSHECDVNGPNARLIAAAPELLEALQWAMRQIPEPALPSAYTTRFEQASAAIAKALGTDK